jgi:hypothetical protein
MNADTQTEANPFNGFVRFWQDMMSQAAGGPAGFDPAARMSSESLRQMRQVFFEAMSRACDEFMRSPPFLEMMKQTMDQSLAFRKQINEFLTSALQSAQAPTQDDMGEILKTLHTIETGLLRRVEDLSARVASMESGRKGRDSRSKSARKTAGSVGARVGSPNPAARKKRRRR